MLYHYTTFETLLRIFESVTIENDIPYIQLRATRIDMVNDPTEMKIDVSLLKSILQTYEIKNNIEGSKCISKQIDKINPNKIKSILDKERKDYTPYIMCFSLKEDYIPMWSLYGDKHHGACLCFAPSIMNDIQKNGIRTKVVYKECKKSETIQNILSILYPKIENNSDIEESIADLFWFISPVIKNIKYSYEKEFRICLYNFMKNEVKSTTDSSIEDIIRYDNDAEYINVKIPLSTLRYILLGAKLPSSLKDIMNNYFLEKYNIRFKMSKVPYK